MYETFKGYFLHPADFSNITGTFYFFFSWPHVDWSLYSVNSEGIIQIYDIHAIIFTVYRLFDSWFLFELHRSRCRPIYVHWYNARSCKVSQEISFYTHFLFITNTFANILLFISICKWQALSAYAIQKVRTSICKPADNIPITCRIVCHNSYIPNYTLSRIYTL